MAKTVFDVLREQLETERSAYMAATADGAPKDWAAYRELCGVIRGLDTALAHMADLLQQRLEDDDE